MKATRTSRYLLDSNVRNGFDGYITARKGTAAPGREFMHRLSWRSTPKLEFDASELAQVLRDGLKDTLLFCDTSVFDNKTDRRIWDSLFARQQGIVLLPSVRRELEPWIARNEGHVAARAVVDRNPAFREFDLSTLTLDERATYTYYVTLLAFRKRLFQLVPAGKRAALAPPNWSPDPVKFRSQIHQMVGPRGYLLAKKGAEQPGAQNFQTDEDVVFWAVYTGITSGKDVAILTKDEDLQEQFYKLLYLMDTQYRATLLADIYASNPGGFIAHEMPEHPELCNAFESGGVLVERSDEFIWKNLPVEFRPVALYCLVLGDRLTQMTFCAEQEMSRILQVKGSTGGLNTDCLDGQNCHLWLAPMNVPRSIRGCAAIARDRSIPSKVEKVALPILDLIQAANSIERFRRFREPGE